MIETEKEPYASARWRLLKTPPADGAWNMAVDETLLEAVVAGSSLPTFRLYAWAPPCLSIGYAQSLEDVDLDRLRTLGWTLVRRPTGGKAILHTDELTYSIIGPQEEPRLAGGILESYRRLAPALLQALHTLDLPAKMVASPSPSPAPYLADDPVCFDVPSNYEITVKGKKIVGSAQARRLGGVLQHGTLPLFGDLTRITQVLRYARSSDREAAARRLTARATTIEQVGGKRVSWDETAAAFIDAARSVLNLELVVVPLTPREKDRAQELKAAKYTQPGRRALQRRN